MEITDEYGVLHRVWRMSNQETIGLVQTAMKEKKLIIADGHHRYETALTYRNERRAAAGSARDVSAPYEFAMMTFVNMDAPGLVILPTHRVVHRLDIVFNGEFSPECQPFFHRGRSRSGVGRKARDRDLREAAHTGTSFVAVTRDRAFLLSRPKSPASAFEGVSLRQQGLDVVQLHKCLLEAALGISGRSNTRPEKCHLLCDTSEAMALAREGSADVAFLMNPARIQQVRDIAFGGEVLPQKSTDFFPKLLSGLTIYALE